MTRAEYAAAHGYEPHDTRYWGQGGVNIARWDQFHCRRGADYRDVGNPAASGTPNQRRSISGGRKAYRPSSENYERQDT